MARKRTTAQHFNALHPAIIAEAIALRGQHKTCREIAKRLGIHLETAKRYVGHIPIERQTREQRLEVDCRIKDLMPWPAGATFSSLSMKSTSPAKLYRPPSSTGWASPLGDL